METRLQKKQKQELEQQLLETSKSTQIQTNQQINDMSTTTTSPEPKMPKFSGIEDGLQIIPFINMFELLFSALTSDQKVHKVIAFLDGDAANYFGLDILSSSTLTWQTVKDKLISRYGHSDIPPMTAATRRKFDMSSEGIKQYYDDKCRILRRIEGLSESHQSDSLTEGLPDTYRTHFYGRCFTSTLEWLTTALDIEADMSKAKPTSPQSKRRKSFHTHGQQKSQHWPKTFHQTLRQQTTVRLQILSRQRLHRISLALRLSQSPGHITSTNRSKDY